MFNLQGSEIIVILLLALVVLGPEKLPDAIRRFSQTYAELKKMGTGFQTEFRQAMDEPLREMRETAAMVKDAADPNRIMSEAEEEARLEQTAADADAGAADAAGADAHTSTGDPTADDPTADNPTGDDGDDGDEDPRPRGTTAVAPTVAAPTPDPGRTDGYRPPSPDPFGDRPTTFNQIAAANSRSGVTPPPASNRPESPTNGVGSPANGAGSHADEGEGADDVEEATT